MDSLRVRGGNRLEGKVRISGSKNAALPLMAASILSAGTVRLRNLPYLRDVTAMATLMADLGVGLTVEQQDADQGLSLVVEGSALRNYHADYDLVRKMRASVLVLGPLLARYGVAEISLPGGCAIGGRPIDLHLDGLRQLGAEITLNQGYVSARAPSAGLHGGEIRLASPSVGATENILMAACLARGETIIHNAAREPEIVALGRFLVTLGAQIEGLGESRLCIHGCRNLSGGDFMVPSDRIEAGTFMVAAAITGGCLTLENAQEDELGSVISALRRCGVEVESSDLGMRVWASSSLAPLELDTAPYPGFPTDLQAQFIALMTQASGCSRICDRIFPQRFAHLPELSRLGARLRLGSGGCAFIEGPTPLTAAQVTATDLRASVALVLAALASRGESTIHRVYHLDRGYEQLEDKLLGCGAVIERLSD